MDADTSYATDSGRSATSAAPSASSATQAFLYALPGFLDVVICEEPDEPEAKAA